MINRFLRWLAPKPAPKREYHFKGFADLANIAIGSYAGMSLDHHRRARLEFLKVEIARLKRNKKRHSHLQQELDRLNA